MSSVLRAALLIGLPSVSLLPVYLKLHLMVSTQPGTADWLEWISSIPHQTQIIFRAMEAFWWGAIVVAVLVPFTISLTKSQPLAAISQSLGVGLLIVLLITRQFRLLYLAPTVVVLILGSWLQELDASSTRSFQLMKRFVSSALLLAIFAQTYSGLTIFQRQRNHYGRLTTGMVEALRWVEHSTPTESLIAVTPTGEGFPLGWWVEGLGQRNTLTAARLSFLNFADERRRAMKANLLFEQGFPTHHALETAQEMNVDYLFVDKSWDGYLDFREGNGARKGRDGTVAFENGSVVITHVPQEQGRRVPASSSAQRDRGLPPD
jgi:hypothetical protein